MKPHRVWSVDSDRQLGPNYCKSVSALLVKGHVLKGSTACSMFPELSRLGSQSFIPGLKKEEKFTEFYFMENMSE